MLENHRTVITMEFDPMKPSIVYIVFSAENHPSPRLTQTNLILLSITTSIVLKTMVDDI